jgi:hypothetical protein
VIQIVVDGTAPPSGCAAGRGHAPAVDAEAPAASTAAPLVVRVARAPHPAADLEAAIRVAVADEPLARALVERIAVAVRAAAALSPEPLPVVQLRSRKALAALAPQLAGALAIVPITPRNARHLPELVDGIRAAGAAAVQLVWDGATPARARVERHLFAALERARATPAGPPVIVAQTAQPAAALPLLIAQRVRRQGAA